MKYCRTVLNFFAAALLMAAAAQAQTPPADAFNPGANGAAYAFAIQPDGKVLAGGSFTTLGGQPRNYLGRLNADGSLDTGFNPGSGGTVYAMAVQPDGKILVGGSFSTLGGQSRANLGRLNADGSLDTTFNPGSGGTVYAMAMQPDGKILVGGSFTTLVGQTRNRLGRLNADGSLDADFNPGANNLVYALALQVDGKILAGGGFTTLAGQSYSRIGRLNTDGTLDANFNPGANLDVYSLAIQADGKILVCGFFSTLGGQTRNRLGRLNADGSLDAAFNPEANSFVYALALQVDGKILVGGSLSTLAGQSRTNLGRLNADGSLDSSFVSAASGTVYSLALQAGGEVLVGGNFTTLGGQSRTNLGRFAPTAPATNTLVFNGTTAIWLRGGVGPEFWRTTLDGTTNGNDWVSLGDGQRVAGGWQWTGLSFPTNANLRARGFVTGGQYNGSSWFAETAIGPRIIILSQPATQTNDAGRVTTFSVGVAGTPPFAYRWLKDGLSLTDGGNIAGTAGATLTLSNAFRADEGAYSVIVSNASGSVTSVVATLSVVDPAILTQPAAQTRNVGETAVFTAAAGGTPALSYQWYRDGQFLADETNSTVTLTNVQAADAGSAFQVVVDNGFGSVTSVVARLTVNLALTDAFNPGVSGGVPFSGVFSMAIQGDGRILVGGMYYNLGGQSRNYLGRLNADGSLDASFNPGVSGSEVDSLAVQTDSKIVVGGYFSTLGGQSRTNLGRLNADGSLDMTFNPGASKSGVLSLVMQADGKTLAGGSFTNLAGQRRAYLGRLNDDDTLDMTFDPGADNRVYSLALQADGKILVGGSFGTLGGQSRSYIGRLHADGALDATFSPGANGPISTLAIQADGKILVGGSFTSLGGQSRNNLGRLNADGTVDMTFNPGADNTVYSLAFQADGKIVVGGYFSMLGGQPRNNLGRLNADGTVDLTFNPGANSLVFSLALQPDGKILVGGMFTTLGGQPRSNIGRLSNTEAATDSLTFDGSTATWLRGGAAPEVWRTSFDASTNGTTWISLGAGERIAGGWELNGLSLPANSYIRARGFVTSGEYNGSSWFVETTCGPPLITSQPLGVKNLTNTTVSLSVTASGTMPLWYQWYKDGTALVNATNANLSFPSLAWSDAGHYQVVVSNGFGSVTSVVAVLTVLPPALPDSFDPGANGTVYALVPQTDGKVWVGGNFTILGGQSCTNLGRLNADGAMDTSFSLGANGTVYSLAMQSDGKILVGGGFTGLGGQNRTNLGRLNTDGTVDLNFNPGANNAVYSLAIQADSKIVVGGYFWELGGQWRNRIGRLNADGTVDLNFNPGADYAVYSLAVQADSKIVVGGDFWQLGGQWRHYIGRLNADGTLDSTFDPYDRGASGKVYSLAMQPDGKIVVGGAFDSLIGASRKNIGRLNTNGMADAFNPGASSPVYSLAIQADGKILAGGSFSTLGGQPRSRIGRLNADGILDTTFNPGASGTAYSLVLQGDGKILAGGAFTTLGGQLRNNIGRLSNTEVATDNLSFDGSAVTWLRGATAPEVWRTTFETSTNGTDWLSAGDGQRIAGGWQRSGVTLTANGTIRARGFATGGQYSGSSWFVESLLPVVVPPRPVIFANDGNCELGTNGFGFRVGCSSGQAVVIEASTDFIVWTPIQTNLVTSAGAFLFNDPQSASFPRRFYRARLYTGVLPPPAIHAGDGSMGFQAERFGFNLAGVAGQRVVVESSPDLVNWSPLTTNLLESALFYFSDSDTTNFPYRFYRAREE